MLAVRRFVIVFSGAMMCACPTSPPAPDSGPLPADGGSLLEDAGQSTNDAGAVTPDAGATVDDSGINIEDAGAIVDDGGEGIADGGARDGGTGVFDAGTGDAGLALEDAGMNDAGSADAGSPDAGSDVCALSCGEGLRCVVDDETEHCVFEIPQPCTADDPCTQTREGDVITSPTEIPSCSTPELSAHADFDDNPPRALIDDNGNPRYACFYSPAPGEPRPLIVFLHGGKGSAQNLYGATTLRERAPTFDLSEDPERPGFALLAMQARNLHFRLGNLYDGIHTDTVTWDLENNADVTNLNAWLDTLVAEGHVDEQRIYLAGWSEGAMFSQLFAFEHQSRIASAALFSGSSPYEKPFENDTIVSAPRLPTSTLPIIGISRTCDIVACDAAQGEALAQQGEDEVTGISVDVWQEQLANTVQNPNVEWHLIRDDASLATTCALTCGYTRAFLNHITWPDAVNGDVDQELRMLNFLRDHPL